MDHGVYYCLVALLPLAYFLLKSLSKKAPCHGLELPPGPWQLPVVGSIHHLRGSLLHRALRDLSLRHGPLMFLKFGELPVVVASTPDAAKEVMKTHDAIFSTRPQSFAAKTATKDGQGIVRAPYGDHWRQLRKICTMALLNARRVQSLRPAREEEASRLVQAVSSSSSPSTAAAAAAPLVDLGKLVAMYVADASLHAIFGRRFKASDRDTLLHYLDEGVRLAGGFTARDLFPSSWLARALSRRRVRVVQAYYHSFFAFMDGVFGEHLQRPRSGEEEEEDLIDTLLRIQKEGNLQFPLTMRIIKAVILVSVY
jgi:cytochrome P450